MVYLPTKYALRHVMNTVVWFYYANMPAESNGATSMLMSCQHASLHACILFSAGPLPAFP